MHYKFPNIVRLARIHNKLLRETASPKETMYYFYWLTDKTNRVDMAYVAKLAKKMRKCKLLNK